MRTSCPECGSNIQVRSPGTSPAAPAACDVCGSVVRPGAFCCPHCDAGLQVQRKLLPAEGGVGLCPACGERVHVPPLVAPATSRTATPSAAAGTASTRRQDAQVALAGGSGVPTVAEPVAPRLAPGPDTTLPVTPSSTPDELDRDPEVTAVPLAIEEMEEAEPEVSTKRLHVADLLDDEARSSASEDVSPEPEPEAKADPGSTLKMASPAPRPQRPSISSRPQSAPSSRPAASKKPRRRGRGRGMLVGMVLLGGLSGGGGWAVQRMSLYELPPFPFPQIPIPEPFAWPGLLAAGGAIVGVLLGALLAGRR